VSSTSNERKFSLRLIVIFWWAINQRKPQRQNSLLASEPLQPSRTHCSVLENTIHDLGLNYFFINLLLYAARPWTRPGPAPFLTVKIFVWTRPRGTYHLVGIFFRYSETCSSSWEAALLIIHHGW
jgi:hypothetical protein